MFKQSIFSYSLLELEKQLISLNLKKHNAIQIYNWLYQKDIDTFSKMTNIAKTNIDILDQHFSINSLSLVDKQIEANDQTIKFLFRLHDDNCIESVLMKFDYGYTVCVSSQVGCNMGCKFCASGLLKKIRNLTIDEIVLQVLHVKKYLNKLNGQRLSNVVFMGIGEPFDNYDNLVAAIKILNDDHGLAIGSRHITVSTCGLVDRIILFAQTFKQIGLIISLHAPNDELRSQLMPIDKKYNLAKLMTICKQYIKITNSRITFAYVLLKDVNDSLLHAKQLTNLLKNILCKVNLIVYNKTKASKFNKSNNANLFLDYLLKHGITTTIRLERGKTINAACGQLRANNL